jgi:sporulation protein YlmC with PRC-barrel domain
VVKRISAEALLRLPVRLRGIDVGRAVDVILDPGSGRAVGLDVLCKDDQHRFLPLSAAALDGEEIAVSSSLTMLRSNELDFYRRRASTIRSLRGLPVRRGGKHLGHLHDVVVGMDGGIIELVVANGRGRTHIAVETALRISADPPAVIT